MATRQRSVRAGVMAAGTLAVIALAAGCGSLQGSGAGSSSSTTDTGSATSTTTPATTSSVSGGGSVTQSSGSSGGGGGPAKTPECRSTDLKLGLGQSDGTAGTVYIALQFTNKSGANCVLVGWPGVSYVANGNGQQVGAPAVRDGSIGAQVTLKPGQLASAVVGMVDVGVFDPNVCKPTPVAGFRVYPPDETASMFIALNNATGCAGTTPDPQLKVQTIKAGPGAP